MKKILILFLLFSACGYQPLYNSSDINKLNLVKLIYLEIQR